MEHLTHSFPMQPLTPLTPEKKCIGDEWVNVHCVKQCCIVGTDDDSRKQKTPFTYIC